MATLGIDESEEYFFKLKIFLQILYVCCVKGFQSKLLPNACIMANSVLF